MIEDSRSGVAGDSVLLGHGAVSLDVSWRFKGSWSLRSLETTGNTCPATWSKITEKENLQIFHPRTWVFPDVSKDREAFDPSRRLEILAQQHEVKSQKKRIYRSFNSTEHLRCSSVSWFEISLAAGRTVLSASTCVSRVSWRMYLLVFRYSKRATNTLFLN